MGSYPTARRTRKCAEIFSGHGEIGENDAFKFTGGNPEGTCIFVLRIICRVRLTMKAQGIEPVEQVVKAHARKVRF